MKNTEETENHFGNKYSEYFQSYKHHNSV